LIFLSHIIIFFSTLVDTFRWYTQDPRKTQEKLLRRLLKSEAPQIYKVWDGTYEHFKELVDLYPKNSVNREKVTQRVPTSGTTQGTKYIEYTQSLQKDMSRGINVWLFHLYIKQPRLFFKKMYWSVSPLTHDDFPDDKTYVNPIAQKVLEKTLVVPLGIQKIKDPKKLLYVTVRLLVQSRDLGLVSVWSPSFIGVLLRIIRENEESLLKGLREGSWGLQEYDCADDLKGYSKKLQKRPSQKKEDLTAWMDFVIHVSAWGDASANDGFMCISSLFKNAVYKPKGLTATEGVFSIPITRSSAVFSFGSHFVEFIDVETEEILLCDSLVEGQVYEVVPSLSNGYLRYELGDLIKVAGFYRGVPMFVLLGRKGVVSDLKGEKLSEHTCYEVVREFLVSEEDFIVVSNLENDGYVLLFSCDVNFTGQDVDMTLCSKSFHYGYCRELGQLKPLEIKVVSKKILEKNQKKVSSSTPQGVEKKRYLIV